MTLSVSKMNISNSGVFQAKTLEVDESLFDKSLRIIDSGGPSSGMVNNPTCFDEKKTLFPEQDLPSVAVVPDPGRFFIMSTEFNKNISD